MPNTPAFHEIDPAELIKDPAGRNFVLIHPQTDQAFQCSPDQYNSVMIMRLVPCNVDLEHALEVKSQIVEEEAANRGIIHVDGDVSAQVEVHGTDSTTLPKAKIPFDEMLMTIKPESLQITNIEGTIEASEEPSTEIVETPTEPVKSTRSKK